jgi:putative glutathione S-transferase
LFADPLPFFALQAVIPLFESLDRLEKILKGKDYLVGDVLTEADVR